MASRIPDRDYLIKAIIASQMSIEEELAVINNYAHDPTQYGEEYWKYQEFRSTAKAMAIDAMGVMASAP